MDDLLREFLTETTEHLDTVDVELVRFEKNPADQAILRNIFRLVHTIKGTCGFLGLPRLENLAHAAETLMGQLRDGRPVTSEVVTLVLATVDRIKLILAELDRLKAEPVGFDGDLIKALETAAGAADGALTASPAGPADAGEASDQILLRPLRPGEVPLAELERVFRITRGPRDGSSAAAARGDAAADAVSSLAMPTIRVGIDMLEHLMLTVSELVLTRNQLLDVARRDRDDSGFKAPLQRLSIVTAELQEGIMKTRMQPIGSAWAKLPRVVRDLSNELGKEIELVTLGAQTELDRQILDTIRDPLTHMVRNSADHGIETPAERLAAGKPVRGTIRLDAYHQGGTITIEVSDDGRGLDLPAIRRRAIENDLAGEAEVARMSDEQVAAFIFHPGFSTAEGVNSVSGRGVGMDVVKTNIDAIGGTVAIASEPGRGTRFKLDIPLTLAIVAALIVQVGGLRYALPQVAVMEIVRVRPGSDHAIERVNGAPLIRLRRKLLPVVDLARMLEVGAAGDPDDSFVVIAEVGRQRFGLMVEAVLETEEIVVKSMCPALRDISVFSGNTILGDGSVVLILDPNGLARRIAPDGSWGAPDGPDRDEAAEAAETTTLLVFRSRDRVPKAVPLSLVTRLEEIDAARIEWIGARAVLQYRGGLMPLVAIDADTPIRREGPQPLIVFADGERTMGLAVAEIVDVADVALAIEPVAGRPDLIGSAIVRGRATEIVDIANYLPQAHETWTGGRPARPSGLVLLVEDKPFFRDMLAPVLKAAGHVVRTADSAAEALRVLTRSAVDAIVVDLDMSEQHGLGFVGALRDRPSWTALPVVGLSSRGSPDMLARAEALGILEVVPTFDRSGLLSALAAASRDLRWAS